MQTRTFLFADLRDYTKFVEHHGDAAAATLIGDYRRIVRAEVARHEGAEVKTEGDSFYVVFTSAQAALRCGMAILREADRYSAERPDRPIKVGVGIHAGEPQPHEGQFVGSAVIVAARLAQQAAAGELLVTEIARGLLPHGAAPEMTERDDLVLKGIERAPRVYRVVRRPIEPSSAPLPAPRETAVPAAAPAGAIVARDLIGREAEMRALRDFFDEAALGAGKVVLVAGEAGLGKTALVSRLIDHARANSAQVLIGECTEIEARRPFGPLIDAFIAARIELPRDVRTGGPGAQAVSELDRYVVHGAFLTTLRDASASGPVLLLLEDVHWADAGTLELLQYLPRRVREMAVLVVATYRTDELHRRHPLNATLAELERARTVSEVRLRPLDEDETARLIASALRLDRSPTTDFRRAIHDRCGGNPFFTEEVLRTLVERQDLKYEDGSWRRTKAVAQLELPRTISAAVDQRIRQLADRSLDILRIAAVIGARFDFDLLARVSPAPEGELVAALREAVDAQLVIEEREDRGETYRFRHALTREAVISELLGRERRTLHRRIGEALEARAAGAAERYAEELAYHFDEAGEAEKTITFRRLAAAQASRAWAFARAREHLDRAIELAPEEMPDLPELYGELAEASANSNDTHAGLSASQTAIRLAEQGGDGQRLGDLLLIDASIAAQHGDRAHRERSMNRAVELLERQGASVSLARAHAQQLFHALVERDPRAEAMGRAAIELARRVGHDESLIRALNYTGSVIGGPEGVDMIKESIRLGEAAGDIRRTYGAINNLQLILAEAGEPHAVVESLRRQKLELARKHGLTGGLLGTVLEDEIDDELRAGNWDRVLQLIDDSRGTSLGAAWRLITEAELLVARSGPAASALVLQEGAERILATGGLGVRQLRVAAHTTIVRYLGGDARGAVAAARLAVPAEGQDIRPSITVWGEYHTACVAAVLAADEIGDALARETYLRLAELDVDKHRSTATRIKFAEGFRAEISGTTERALEKYAAAAGMADEWRLQPIATFIRLRRAGLLARRQDLDGARLEFDQFLPYWRKAKATWYLGELEKKARAMGIELVAAGG